MAAFDTLAYAKILQEAGFNQKQAEGMSKALNKILMAHYQSLQDNFNFSFIDQYRNIDSTASTTKVETSKDTSGHQD